MDVENILKETLDEMLKFMSEPDVKIEITNDDNTYKVNVSGLKNSAILIGYHGENLYAFQHILKALAFKKIENKPMNIILDIDNYRKEHEDNIISFAERKVEILRKTRCVQILPPMPAYLRRLVHLHLAQEKFQDIATESIGDMEHRQVTLKLKNGVNS